MTEHSCVFNFNFMRVTMSQSAHVPSFCSWCAQLEEIVHPSSSKKYVSTRLFLESTFFKFYVSNSNHWRLPVLVQRSKEMTDNDPRSRMTRRPRTLDLVKLGLTDSSGLECNKDLLWFSAGGKASLIFATGGNISKGIKWLGPPLKTKPSKLQRDW